MELEDLKQSPAFSIEQMKANGKIGYNTVLKKFRFYDITGHQFKTRSLEKSLILKNKALHIPQDYLKPSPLIMHDIIFLSLWTIAEDGEGVWIPHYIDKNTFEEISLNFKLFGCSLKTPATKASPLYH